ncbi:MAG: glycoside hydrolase family 2 protein [Faecousia sp.]
MNRTHLSWTVGHTDTLSSSPRTWYTAQVPGAVQLDYAAAHHWPPFYEGEHFKDYAWMEDCYWIYRAPLCFSLKDGQRAFLVFQGIDYRYTILVDGQVLCDGEGMFHTVRCDVTAFAGYQATVEVILHPAPKSDLTGTRSQADHSCKPAACYGWDWHPRLVSSGLWEDAWLSIEEPWTVQTWDMAYTLAEDLRSCTLQVSFTTQAAAEASVQVLWQGEIVACETICTSGGRTQLRLDIPTPHLWYPVGLGEQALYTVQICSHPIGVHQEDTLERKIGFRRAKLVMNEGSWALPGNPKSRSDAPATLEINGQKMFAKGSNWVNTDVFPGATTQEQYRQLLHLVRDANMNILRVWGGGYVNKESFYALCDELGILVWQEFPLACNNYPDDPDYLAVLEQEATAIVRRLRCHPCMALWCGGNELFNGWSGMTEQSHALRLLDAVCFREDPHTPFIMTSPVNGMGHGPYRCYDDQTGMEAITQFLHAHNTAYTEFGAPGMSSMQVLRTFLTDKELADCSPNNPVWTSHFGFWAAFASRDYWIRTSEVEHFFGGWTDVEDLCIKTRFLQAMTYQMVFEESRRQWPHCSMALNWCLNDVWPTAANNSLLDWPFTPKPAYEAVRQALRPQIPSLRVERCLWWDTECFQGELWILNDSLEALPAGQLQVSYRLDGAQILWGTLCFPELPPQSNLSCGSIQFPMPKGFHGLFSVRLELVGLPEGSSEYRLICRSKETVSTAGVMNI